MSSFVSNHSILCRSFLEQIDADAYIVHNGRLVDANSTLEKGCLYQIYYRLRGGKGGFGSMLRTIGAQIEKTTNREAMRDLSGRRMRDINNEKKLAEWVAGAADREREKEKKKQERLEKRRAEIEDRVHRFHDDKYMQQKDAVANNLDDALTQGLKRAAGTSSSSAPPSKKGKEKATPSAAAWCGLGVDPDLLSSSDDEESESSKPDVLPEEVDPATDNKDIDQSKLDSKNTECSESQQVTKDGVDSCTTEGSAAIENSETTDASKSDDSVQDGQSIDLESHESAKQLEVYGSEKLEAELIRRSIKSDGSLEEKAERLFSIKGLSADEIDASLLSKSDK